LALVVGRSLQGVSAAVSVPAALPLLATATPDPADRHRALSAWSAAGAAAGASGFVLGGAMTEVADWRAMFWINLPLAVLIARGVLRGVAGDRIAVERHLDAAGGAPLYRGPGHRSHS
jgi:MFS family permease